MSSAKADRVASNLPLTALAWWRTDAISWGAFFSLHTFFFRSTYFFADARLQLGADPSKRGAAWARPLSITATLVNGRSYQPSSLLKKRCGHGRPGAPARLGPPRPRNRKAKIDGRARSTPMVGARQHGDVPHRKGRRRRGGLFYRGNKPKHTLKKKEERLERDGKRENRLAPICRGR